MPRKKYGFKTVDDKLTIVHNSGIEWVEEITTTRFKAKAGNNPWNDFLNINPPLMKNFEYRIDNNFIYKTDEYGRVEKITVENLELNPNRTRDSYPQAKAKEIKDGNLTPPVDNGGHMVGNQFYGPSEQINYFPQNAESNQSGIWYQMEQELRQLRLNNPNATIKVEIVPEFPNTIGRFNDPFRRPDWFNIDVEIDGVPHQITNPRIANPF